MTGKTLIGWAFLAGLLAAGFAGCTAGGPTKTVAVVDPIRFDSRSEAVLPGGRHVAIPPPVGWPAEASQTGEYRQWSQRGNVQQLRYRAPDKRVYVGDFVAVYLKSDDAQPHAGIFKVARYREDGTLEVVTSFPMSSGTPVEWTYFNNDGASPAIKVSQAFHVETGPRLTQLQIYDRDGSASTFHFTGTDWRAAE